MRLSNRNSATSRKKSLAAALDGRLDRRLLSYASAALAAGVGVMAMRQPSAAEVVYTPTNVTLPDVGASGIDLNHDGITDFSIVGSTRTEGVGFFQKLYVSPFEQNGVEVGAANSSAMVLPKGARIGPGGRFDARYGRMFSCLSAPSSDNNTFYGYWVNKKAQYLGLRFLIDGKVHYGWARISVKSETSRLCKVSGTINGYAYETEPGKAILAGQTSGEDEESASARPNMSLGALALGHVARQGTGGSQ
jgi:hypothetical protein